MSGGVIIKDIEFLAHKIEADIDQILLERYGIGYAQYKVLDVVSRNSGCSQKLVASSLLQTEASVSRQVKILKTKNLIIITNSTSDHRKKIITFTARGTDVYVKSTRALSAYGDSFLATVSSKDTSSLLNILATLK